MRKKKIRRTFDESTVPKKYRGVLSLWGSDDCFFSIEEIALLTKQTSDKIKNQIAELKKSYPNAYKFYAARRQHLRKQNDFEEDKTKRFSSDLMDEEFSWLDNSTVDLPTTNQRDALLRNQLNDRNRRDY